jgi:hypothetical protein
MGIQQSSATAIYRHKESLCVILVEFGIPMILERLMKMRLDETYRRVRVGKHLSDMLPIKSGLKQDAYHNCFSTLL